jgi:capsular exopolysaccharide synthesis family protein
MSEQPQLEPLSAVDLPRIALAGEGAHNSSPSASPHGYGGNILGNTEVHLLDYVKVIYKRRWPALSAFVIIVLSVAVYTFTAIPIYEAHALILIEKENTNVVTFKEAFEQNQITDDYYQTQYKILQSRALARRTMDSLKLWDSPQFNPKPDGSISIRQIVMAPVAWLSQSIRRSRSIESPLQDETRAQSALIDKFLAALTVTPVRNSRLVDVTFESPSASQAAIITNALARNYIEENLEFKFLATKEATDWLGQRLSEQRQQVENSEHALQRYREQTDAVSLEEKQNIVVQKLADLNAAVTRAKTERIQKEAAYNQIRSLQTDRTALDTFPAILSNGFIQQQKNQLADLQRQQAQLADKLGANHPDMVKLRIAIETAEAKIRAEIGKIVQAMGNDYQQALAQEQSLSTALDQQKQDALSLNRKGIEYGSLARDAAANRQIFDSLMQRTKETGISGELKTSNIRVVDAAEIPRRPATPNTRNNFLLALGGGFVFSIGLAFFFEYIDNRIKNPDELRQMGLPFLGMVPAVFDSEGESPMINKGVPTTFAESFRAVRTNVLFSSADQGSRSIAITSTAPGEGKTIVAANLAIALGQAGQRVLLIDADMRKPRVHAVFGKPQEPGLSNVLSGNARSSEAVHKTTVSGLWVMPAGLLPPNPAELLGSKRFSDFVTAVMQHFDWIVLDTPPVMAVTDSSLVAHLTSGVVFVVGAEMASRHAIQRSLEQLDRAHAKFFGTVLNRVDLQHNAYYYSQYYRREYSDYYQKDLSA